MGVTSDKHKDDQFLDYMMKWKLLV